MIKMKTEKEKMLAGEMYYPADPELTKERLVARQLCARFNQSVPGEEAEQREILNTLFGTEVDVRIEQPFYCDYGPNIQLGSQVYFNFGCVILDTAPVIIGDNVLIGPSVQIYAPLHPLDADERRSGIEYSRPIVIGADVWIGGNATICPGVTIGARSVVGAGSVVTRDVPEDVVVAGSPARVIKKILK